MSIGMYTTIRIPGTVSTNHAAAALPILHIQLHVLHVYIASCLNRFEHVWEYNGTHGSICLSLTRIARIFSEYLSELLAIGVMYVYML